MIEIKNEKLYKYLIEKDQIVKEGRAISVELEALEKKIASYENKEKVITSRVEPKELIEKIGILSKTIESMMKELDDVADEIKKQKLAAIPEKIKTEHTALLAKRKELETERNKKALAVQKIKDRATPIIQKETKKFLKEYEDLETAIPKDGVVLVKTFSHLEDFKNRFNAQKK